MGWLELLPLLKRVLPLLTRVAPMLETFIATRGSGQTDAALDRFAGVVNLELANVSRKHDDLNQVLAGQAADLNAMRSEMVKIRASDERTTARLLQIETQVAELGRTLRIAAVSLGVLLAICIGLLVTMLLIKGA